MHLRTVVRIHRRVVASDQVLGRKALLERRYRPTAGTLSTILVLVSRAVPPDERAEVVTRLLLAHARHAIANDIDPAACASFLVTEEAPPSSRLGGGGRSPLL